MIAYRNEMEGENKKGGKGSEWVICEKARRSVWAQQTAERAEYGVSIGGGRVTHEKEKKLFLGLAKRMRLGQFR